MRPKFKSKTGERPATSESDLACARGAGVSIA